MTKEVRGSLRASCRVLRQASRAPRNSEEGSREMRLLLTTFGLVFLAELGDKTQLAVFTLVARHSQPIPIFLGAALALVLVTAVGVVAGQGVAQVVPDTVLRRGAAALFVVMGVLIWFDLP